MGWACFEQAKNFVIAKDEKERFVLKTLLFIFCYLIDIKKTSKVIAKQLQFAFFQKSRYNTTALYQAIIAVRNLNTNKNS